MFGKRVKEASPLALAQFLEARAFLYSNLMFFCGTGSTAHILSMAI